MKNNMKYYTRILAVLLFIFFVINVCSAQDSSVNNQEVSDTCIDKTLWYEVGKSVRNVINHNNLLIEKDMLLNSTLRQEKLKYVMLNKVLDESETLIQKQYYDIVDLQKITNEQQEIIDRNRKRNIVLYSAIGTLITIIVIK